MDEICKKCNTEIGPSDRVCHYCEADVGFPNVRAARDNKELKALETRYLNAVESASSSGCDDSVNTFKAELESSSATICMDFGKLLHHLNPRQLLVNFHNEVARWARIPEDNEYDGIRGSVDETLFPNYSNHINFAALSLDDHGVNHYGGWGVVLREDAIEDRATVFEANSLLFLRARGMLLEPGYRATWSDRAKLCTAKLAEKLKPSSSDRSEFARLLVSDDPDGDGDYVEVHIYGSLNARAFALISSSGEVEPEETNIVSSHIAKYGLDTELAES